MDSEGSVSNWIAQLKVAEEAAAAKLWDRYFARLIGLARKKIRHQDKRVYDEDDVVVDAFDTFFRHAKQGHYPDLKDRDDLWHLLVKITEHKAIDRIRRANRQKRGGGKVRGDSVFIGHEETSSGRGLNNVPAIEPTPEFAALMVEQVEVLLSRCDGELRQIAIMKLDGHTNQEIASAIGRAVATVERRLRLIRAKWSEVAEQ